MNGPALKRIQAENLALLERKNAAYGSQNIELTGLMGIAVRLLDKVMRLKTLTLDKSAPPGDETVADTLRDIANYALIAQALEAGEWGRVDPDAPAFAANPEALLEAVDRWFLHGMNGQQDPHVITWADGVAIGLSLALTGQGESPQAATHMAVRGERRPTGAQDALLAHWIAQAGKRE